jgi:hypothetical protein
MWQRREARWLLGMLALQWVLGMSNVIFDLPLWVAVGTDGAWAVVASCPDPAAKTFRLQAFSQGASEEAQRLRWRLGETSVLEGRTALRERLRAYVALTKPRVALWLAAFWRFNRHAARERYLGLELAR